MFQRRCYEVATKAARVKVRISYNLFKFIATAENDIDE